MTADSQITSQITSEHPVRVWVDASLLDTRLDAEFYQPVYLRTIRAILSTGFPHDPLIKLCKKKARVYWGIKGLEAPPSETHIPYIRPNEVDDDGWVSYGDLTTVERHWANDLPDAVARPGDLLVEVKGNARKVHVVRTDVPSDTFVSGSMFRFVLDGQLVDSHYVWAYLSSPTCQTMKERLMSNSIIKWINPDDICDLPVPRPPHPIQDYIGAKVRLAERCRLRARELRTEAQLCLDEGVRIDVSSVTQASEGKRFRILFMKPETALINPDLMSSRLDAGAYSPVRLALLDALRDARCEFCPIELVADDVAGERKRSTRAKSNAIYFASILHINDKGVVDFEQARSHDPVSPGIVCTKDDVLFSGINPRQNRVAVWTKAATSLCSAEFAVYRAKPGFLPFYLSFVWRSQYCLNQLEALTRGTSSSRRRLQEEDFAELLVPVLSQEDRVRIAYSEEKAVTLDTKASQLIREAKSDIEALIEGRLDVDGIMAGRIKPPTWDEIGA